MKAYIARDENGKLYLHPIKPHLKNVKPTAYWNNEDENWMQLPEELYPIATFLNSPIEVEIIETSTLDAVYEGLDQYENFLGMVACMRRAQKEANDMIAQVECYEEAMEHVKKAEELESMVDKWLEGYGATEHIGICESCGDSIYKTTLNV